MRTNIFVVLLAAACGGGDGRETASASGGSTGPGTSGPGTMTAGSSSGPGTSEPTGGMSGESGEDSTSAAPTSSVGPAGTTTTGPDATTSGDTGSSSGGGFTCDPNAVADTLAFSYISKFDTGIPDKILQASYYNTVADEVMIMSYNGSARRFTVDGTPLSDVFPVPMEALPSLDGATFDAVQERGLLINQPCVLVEVEPQTLAVISSQQLGFGMSICAGLALGLDNNLYIASYGTNELVVLSRDGLTEVRRVDMVNQVNLSGFDGIALIAGSENFLVMSTAPTKRAAIIDPFGTVVVPASDLGEMLAPMIGGQPMLPDAVLTICGNGHAWVCEAYDATCFDYAPEDGDKNACGCLVPQ